MPRSPHANENGCVPVGTLEDYAGGRSNGCTTWSRSDAEKIIPLLRDDGLHLPGIGGRQGGCASRLGPPAAFVQQALLERLLPEANRCAEILVKRVPRTAPRAISQGSGPGPQPRSDLQAVDSVSLNSLYTRRFAGDRLSLPSPRECCARDHRSKRAKRIGRAMRGATTWRCPMSRSARHGLR